MSAQQPSGSALTRETILRALSSLSEELGKLNVTGELCTGLGLRLHSPRFARCCSWKSARLSRPESLRERQRPVPRVT
jgi:hypothetical protein